MSAIYWDFQANVYRNMDGSIARADDVESGTQTADGLIETVTRDRVDRKVSTFKLAPGETHKRWMDPYKTPTMIQLDRNGQYSGSSEFNTSNVNKIGMQIVNCAGWRK